MNLEKYPYSASLNFLDYEFYSEGPNGAIKKVVRFEKIILPPYTFYNLGFGDWDELDKRVNDSVNSNNLDAEKILATVAATIIDFTNHFPGAVIYAEGSTPARTRRYQMGINKFWQEIIPIFDVYGLVESKGFQPFETNRNYKAFAIHRK